MSAAKWTGDWPRESTGCKADSHSTNTLTLLGSVRKAAQQRGALPSEHVESMPEVLSVRCSRRLAFLRNFAQNKLTFELDVPEMLGLWRGRGMRIEIQAGVDNSQRESD